jgi:uncharacterized protein YecT (DUF1311 family)
VKALSSLFVLFLASCSSFAQNSAEYRSCSANAKSTPEIHACANQEAIRVDKELNGVYRSLLTKAEKDPIATAKFKAAERAWIAYRDAYIEAMYPAENKQAAYGSIYPTEVLLLSTKLTRQQIDALNELFKNYDDSQ